MLRRRFTQCVLRPADLEPSCEDMEVVGAFNPGGIRVDGSKGQVVLLVRVAEKPKHVEPGCTALPRYEIGKGIVVDQMPNDQLIAVDPRVVQQKSDGCRRLTFVSHLRVVRSSDGRTFNADECARFIPENEYETFGVEDPRITRIGDRYYFTYVAVSLRGVVTALASTNDFRTFERHGIIFCPENKDVLLFPERIAGQYVAIHRPNPATHFSPPEMWLARSDDLIHWGRHERLLGGGASWDAGRVGGGCPPIRTNRGWLAIYHGNNKTPGENGVGDYFGAACLMELEDPSRIIAYSNGPMMMPQADFEIDGFVPNVVFPTAAIEQDKTLLVYYGAADTNTGVVAFDRDDFLDSLRRVD